MLVALFPDFYLLSFSGTVQLLYISQSDSLSCKVCLKLDIKAEQSKCSGSWEKRDSKRQGADSEMKHRSCLCAKAEVSSVTEF